MKHHHLWMAALLLALPILGQTPAELKTELRKKEQQAKSDTKALVAVARWAKEHQLATDYERILNQVLKLDPQNEAAHLGLGHVKHKDKWMDPAKVEILDAQEKGWVKVDGVLVPKEEEADAKKGIYHHEGQLVSKDELSKLRSGMVRHPRTGELIAKDDKAKADQGLFPTASEWVDLAGANRFHADLDHPWVVRTTYTTLVSTMPLEDLEKLKIEAEVDAVYEFASGLFDKRQPTPANRATILLAASEDEYKKLGAQLAGPASSYGAFIVERVPTNASFGKLSAVANAGNKNWSAYWVRHATGLAMAHGLMEDVGLEPPFWFVSGVGGYAERLYKNAGWFAKQFLGAGGLQNLKSWFNSYDFAGQDYEPITRNIFQAALVVSFAAKGDDKDTQKAMKDVVLAFDKGGKTVNKAIEHLEKVLLTKQDAVRAYLQKIASS